jgi:two-component system, chemotaxis family, chemotaxis protein CheY
MCGRASYPSDTQLGRSSDELRARCGRGRGYANVASVMPVHHRITPEYRSTHCLEGPFSSIAMNVLLVDDNKAMRLSVRRTLLETGVVNIRVYEAENGSDALAQLAAVAPDLILSDWNMPEMGGVDLLRELRARCCNVPFGFVTPQPPTAQMRERASEAGAQFMLAKPLSVQPFRDMLRSLNVRHAA